jgi:glucokinase
VTRSNGDPETPEGARSRQAIGIDLGGTKILAGVVDQTGRVLRSVERPTPLDSESSLVAAIEAAVGELVGGGVEAVGIGVPSRVDQRTGRAVFSANVPLADVPLRGLLHERFGLPVAVDNDANAAAVAEWRVGAGRGTRTMVMLTLGTGVGGGLILDGKPFRGATGAAAELGHMVLEHDGPPCQGTCLGRGHVEALLSGTAATRRAREALGPDADARTLVQLAGRGDPAATAALAEVGRRLGSVLGTLVNVFDPELIVIGGGFGAAFDLLLASAREVFIREALPPARDTVRIVPARLGPAAGLVGAGLVGLEAADAPDGRLA